MSRKEYIQCDACEKTCSNPLPSDWLALREGGDYTYTNDPTLHFCSKECLFNWLCDHWEGYAHLAPAQPTPEPQTHNWKYIPVMCKPLEDGSLYSLASGMIYKPAQEPQEQPSCKARRFLLVDGNTAEITEGVKWPSGWVSLDTGAVAGEGIYVTWDYLKERNPGSGVQWIDQEVSE